MLRISEDDERKYDRRPARWQVTGALRWPNSLVL